jgi:hypothetical protein
MAIICRGPGSFFSFQAASLSTHTVQKRICLARPDFGTEGQRSQHTTKGPILEAFLALGRKIRAVVSPQTASPGARLLARASTQRSKEARVRCRYSSWWPSRLFFTEKPQRCLLIWRALGCVMMMLRSITSAIPWKGHYPGGRSMTR